MNCSNCTFFKEKSPHNGYCHRYPPHPNEGFPVVANEAWCGEHKRRMEGKSLSAALTEAGFCACLPSVRDRSVDYQPDNTTCPVCKKPILRVERPDA